MGGHPPVAVGRGGVRTTSAGYLRQVDEDRLDLAIAVAFLREVEFHEDGIDVLLNRPWCDEQRLTNGGVSLALGHVGDHLGPSFGEAVKNGRHTATLSARSMELRFVSALAETCLFRREVNEEAWLMFERVGPMSVELRPLGRAPQDEGDTGPYGHRADE